MMVIATTTEAASLPSKKTFLTTILIVLCYLSHAGMAKPFRVSHGGGMYPHTPNTNCTDCQQIIGANAAQWYRIQNIRQQILSHMGRDDLRQTSQETHIGRDAIRQNGPENGAPASNIPGEAGSDVRDTGSDSGTGRVIPSRYDEAGFKNTKAGQTIPRLSYQDKLSQYLVNGGVKAPSIKKPFEISQNIVTFSEIADLLNATDTDNVVQFKLRKGKPDETMEAKSAHLWIHMKHRSTRRLRMMATSKRMMKSFTIRHNRHRRRHRGKRVELRISKIGKDNERDELLTSLRTRIKRTRWQKIGLPLTVVQHLIDSPDRPLWLRVDCVRCGKMVRPMLLYRSKRRKRKSLKSGHVRRRKRLSSRRPFLVVHTRIRKRQHSRTESIG